MSESLKLYQSALEGNVTISLVGQIDEDADYSGAALAKINHITFNFEKVTLVNSTGLQKWISFLNTIPVKIKLAFEKCPPRIVKQIDMFPGFLANRPVEIISFYAPYYCEQCSKPTDVLLMQKDIKKPDTAPESACPNCKTTMEFDAIEKKYFVFLSRMKSAG